jgi:hypothetical protein
LEIREILMNKLRAINPEQLAALLRTIGQVLGGVIATHGWMTDSEWAALSGGIATILLTVWGIFARRDAALIASAANVPVTEKVVVSSPVIAKSENPKVVGE